MPPRRAMRGNRGLNPVQRQAPELAPEPSERVSATESAGQNPGSAEYVAPQQNNPEQNAPDLEEQDTASSTLPRDNAQDPFELMCERMIDRLDQRGRPAQREHSKPSFLDIVATMRSLGTEKFAGGTDPFVADAWMKRLERNFNASRCPEEYKKDVAVYYLDKDAYYWWESLEKHRGQDYAAEYTWQQFQREFLRKYFPVEARDRMEKRFFDLTQRDRSVREYEAEFTRLRRYVSLENEDEAAVARRFLRGLRPDLYSKLQVAHYSDLPTLVELAVNVEDALAAERRFLAESRQERQGRQDQSHQGRRSHDNRLSRKPSRQPPVCSKCGRRGHRQDSCRAPTSTRPEIVCWTCGEKGHISNKCPKGQSAQDGRQDVTCWKCGGIGHFANHCPQGPSIQRPRPPAGQGPSKRPARESAPRQQAPVGRVYALDKDKPESSRQAQGLIAGMHGS